MYNECEADYTTNANLMIHLMFNHKSGKWLYCTVYNLELPSRKGLHKHDKDTHHTDVNKSLPISKIIKIIPDFWLDGIWFHLKRVFDRSHLVIFLLDWLSDTDLTGQRIYSIIYFTFIVLGLCFAKQVFKTKDRKCLQKRPTYKLRCLFFSQNYISWKSEVQTGRVI